NRSPWILRRSCERSKAGIKARLPASRSVTGTPKDLSSAWSGTGKQQLLACGIFGMGLFGALAAATTLRRPDGDFVFPLYGAGPSDYNHRMQLMDQGWQAHSIGTPWGYIPYEWSGAWMVLDTLANYQDAVRYEGMPDGLHAMAWATQRTLSA